MSNTNPPQEGRDEALVRHLRRHLEQNGFGHRETERLLEAVLSELDVIGREGKGAEGGDSRRRRHDVAFAATPLIVEPLWGLMDEWQLGEYRAYCYETVMAALEAYDRAIAREHRRLSPSRCPPSSN